MSFVRRPLALAIIAVALLTAIAAGCSSTSSSSKVTQKGITVSDAWARESAMSSGNGAAYFTITSSESVVDKLLSASVSTSVAGSAQVHQMVAGDGAMMSMKEVSSVEIPAGGTVTFEPGGYHVMLMDLAEPLEAGSKVRLTLGFMNAGSITVEAVVKSE